MAIPQEIDSFDNSSSNGRFHLKPAVARGEHSQHPGGKVLPSCSPDLQRNCLMPHPAALIQASVSIHPLNRRVRVLSERTREAGRIPKTDRAQESP